MPDAFISMTTSWASGVGSANLINSSPRSPVKTTPRIASSACSPVGTILNRKTRSAKGERRRSGATLNFKPFRGLRGLIATLHGVVFDIFARGRPGRQSDRAGGDIDHQRDQRGIENERNNAMRGGGAADGLVGDADVGDLRGHADDEREVHKVPVVGMLVLIAAGKLQAARFGAPVIIMRVMQREGGMHRRP